jgi:hypothetical protein
MARFGSLFWPAQATNECSELKKHWKFGSCFCITPRITAISHPTWFCRLRQGEINMSNYSENSSTPAPEAPQPKGERKAKKAKAAKKASRAQCTAFPDRERLRADASA